MPSRMSVRRTIRPKNRTPKFSIKKSTTYYITDDVDGNLKMTTKKVHSFHVNKV